MLVDNAKKGLAEIRINERRGLSKSEAMFFFLILKSVDLKRALTISISYNFYLFF